MLFAVDALPITNLTCRHVLLGHLANLAAGVRRFSPLRAALRRRGGPVASTEAPKRMNGWLRIKAHVHAVVKPAVSELAGLYRR